MSQPRVEYFSSLGPRGFHRVAYVEWGPHDARHIVVCVHGLTRNSRDFDELARYLAVRGCRVVCMDVVGRGDSDWLDNKADYGFTQYVSDAAMLLARITGTKASLFSRLQGAGGEHVIDWVGTSMGGLIGMMVAAEPGSPIRGLVLNDVGPLIPWPALARLKLAAGGDGVRFASLDDVERYLRDACVSFGPLTDRQWRRLALHGSRRIRDFYVLAYDPAIVSTMRSGGGAGVAFGADFFFGIDLWKIWDEVKSPTLVLRGKESDLLLESTVQRMKERGPKMKAVEFPGIGHAPWLMTEDQIRPVADFLLG